MKTPAPADLHRWSEELARNPASLAFLPLARAYRRLGRRDLALQLCLRGLEHHPTHVEAHALLALLHFEAGERAKAADEWATVLRLKPGNFEALRGMGFRHLEQGDITKARQHLERAALIRPDDTTVQEALRLIRQREVASAARPSSTSRPSPQHTRSQRPAPQRMAPPPRATPPAMQSQAPTYAPSAPPRIPPPPGRPAEVPVARARPEPPPAIPPEAMVPPHGVEPAHAHEMMPEIELEPWSPDDDGPEAVLEAVEPWDMPSPAKPAPPTRRPAPTSPSHEPPAAFRFSAATPSLPMPPDPSHVFDDLLGAGPLLGVLLLDRRGLVLAGTLQGARADVVEDLGAILGGAIDETLRAVQHLDLGEWQGLLLECDHAILHVAPSPGDALLLVAARREAPAGWIVRTAAHAAGLAGRFAEVYS
jgi:predicted regulator of Ras-like GTPase activity (Roadblock/LC7/MglB family)